MKTTKGGKVMNPTDSYRKELRKRELKRNKKERKKVREVGILKKDPDTLKEQIDKLEAMKADGALDKARKHKKRQLEDTLNLVMKKRKEYESKMREKGEEPVMFSHLGPLRRLTTSEEEDRVKHPKPEDSVYYHPTLNPTGAPPPGKPQMYKSSIGPRIPLSGASSSGSVSSSLAEMDDFNLSVPPPPPPPPLPHVGEVDADGSIITESLPLPPQPPPPKPPRPSAADLGTNLPLPPMPPPPPGPPPKEQTVNHQSLPPPPPAVHNSAQPPPPGIGLEREKSLSTTSENIISQEPVQGSGVLPPPPPPPGMPPKPVVNQSEGAPSKSDSANNNMETQELSKVLPPPPPLRQQPPIPGPSQHPALQKDVLPPGISHIPPPPDMRPQLSAPGISSQQIPPGMMVPLMPRPPYGPPPGTPVMMRPPLPPGPPPNTLDGAIARPFVPQKPSYVKSAASTVVKRPLAQHTPQLTSMVPASVRVKRESAIPKPKPKPSLASATTSTTVSKAPPAVAKQESGRSSSGVKPQSVDDSYMAFLEDMKALGALDT